VAFACSLPTTVRPPARGGVLPAALLLPCGPGARGGSAVYLLPVCCMYLRPSHLWRRRRVVQELHKSFTPAPAAVHRYLLSFTKFPPARFERKHLGFAAARACARRRLLSAIRARPSAVFGPVLRPPCSRHRSRPSTTRQGVPARVFAPHNGRRLVPLRGFQPAGARSGARPCLGRTS
jgi:hypothetical protein